jgi:hypothetical protein
MCITAEEWELLSFFEVEPVLREPEEAWCYNDAVYVIQRGEQQLSVAIAPFQRDVRIVLQYNNRRVYEFNAMAVDDVLYRTDAGFETLQIVIGPRERITIRIKPDIEVLHQLDDVQQE